MIGIEFIVLFSFLLRLILADQSFWLDEGASLVIARQPLTAMFSSLAADFHPPLFYFLLHFWLQLGIKAELWLRLPNIIFGSLTVYWLFLLVKQLDKKFGAVAALLSAIFLAFNPMHIYYSQELRMYALSAFLTVVSWWLLIHKDKKRYPLFFSLITTLNIYTFYGAFLNLVAQLVYLFWQDRKSLKQMWPWFALPLILFLPWLPTFLKQLQGGDFIKNALPGWAALSGNLSPKALALIPLKFVLGRVNLPDNPAAQLTAVLSVLYLGGLMFLGRLAKGSKLLLTWTAVPLGLAALLSLWSPMLGYWRYLFVLPATVALAAMGISRLKALTQQINTALVMFIFVCANMLFWQTPSYQRENWKGVATLAQNYHQLTTLHVFAFSDAFAPFRWYLPNAQYIAPLKELKSDPNALDSVLSSAVESKSTVFYFEYLAALTDPQNNIRRWFENAGFKLSKTHNFNGVGFIYEFHPQLLY